MNAYVPDDLPGAMIALASLPIVLLLGFFVTRIPSVALARISSWLIAIIGVACMELYTVSQPPGFRMLAIIGILLYTMKIVVATEVCLSGKARLTVLQWIGFAGFWVGMRPALFAKVPRAPRANTVSYFWRGITNLALGLVLVFAARGAWIASSEWDLSQRLFVSTVLLLPGVSLMLHFGAFNLLTGCWRILGAECDSVFHAPQKSKSLTEFWGRRWNLAFSEMTTLAVYRPLRGPCGNVFALLMGFVFSGVLHELAISVPVRAGFGWPFLYFVLHGIGILIESRWFALAELIKSRPAIGRLWTLSWIVIPLPILFHQPFLCGCVWPLIGIGL
ncbi:MAG: membrane bound O-acyl transferase family-domain-containing protein [Planctomycetales bacterium]|nr:membrane bound O-acyl transferase family-domain-containing protein [Planctomycetales bacterium]